MEGLDLVEKDVEEQKDFAPAPQVPSADGIYSPLHLSGPGEGSCGNCKDSA